MTELPNAASVALVDGDRILLIQRGREPWKGMWSLPGGRLEPGEDAEACAIRELGEEIGVVPARLRPVCLLRTGNAGRYLLQVYATRTFAGDTIANDEIADWRWASVAEAGLLETTPHLVEVLRDALAVAHAD